MKPRSISRFVALSLALAAAHVAAAPKAAPKTTPPQTPAYSIVLDGPDEPIAPAAPAISAPAPVIAPLSFAQLGQAAEAKGEMGQALGYYIRALPSSPDDIAVIMGAARGALATGDADAATNFFSRALTLQPTNGMARAGVARALVFAQRPKEALRQFDIAERYGIDPASYASDRGLAHDLRGEQRRAQQDYRLALTAHPRDPLTLQRYALSLAIQGDRTSARRMLDPLMIGGGNRATQRTLAFIDALTGDSASAVRLASSAMGANQASALAPFFSRLPLLSASERAYAVHFGVLPPATSTLTTTQAKPVPFRVTRSAVDPATARSLAAGDTAPVITDSRVPAGKIGSLSSTEIAAIAASLQGGGILNAKPPLVSTDCVPTAKVSPVKTKSKGKGKVAAKPAKAETCVEPAAKPLVEDCAPAKPVIAVKKGRKTKAAVKAKADPCIAGKLVVAEPTDCAPVKPAGKSKAAKAEPCIDAEAKKQVAAAADCAPVSIKAKPSRGAKSKGTKAKATPKPEPCIDAEAKKQVAAAEDCAPVSISKPARAARGKGAKSKAAPKTAACVDDDAKKQVEAKDDCPPAKGTKGKAAKAKGAACAATPAKAKGKLPERFWVQVASGVNKDDLPKAWSKLKSGAGGKALAARAPYVASAGRSNRLLVGPFTEKDDAQEYLNTLTKAGLSGFTWTSPAGTDVPKLPLK